MLKVLVDYFKPLLSFVFVILISSGLLGFVEPVSVSFRVIVALIIAVGFIKQSKLVNKKYLCFLFYLFMNVLILDPNPYFRPWERLLLFISMFIIVTPLFKSKNAIMFRWKTFRLILLVTTFFSFLSFFGFFLGINFFVRNGVELDDYVSNVGWFSGFFRHSMILGPMAALSACYMLYLYLKNKKKHFLFAMIPLVGAVMLAASRTSFLALFISSFFLIYKYAVDKKKFLKIISSFAFIALLTFPIWCGGLSRMAEKKMDGQFGSRTASWNARLDEFSSAPILGIGFCTQKVNIIVENGTGKVEPGSSWLAILSMTGIIGLFFVCSFFLDSYNIVKKSKSEKSIILMASLIFFIVHMISEGYIYAGGNPICVIVWLVLGCCYDLKYENDMI